MFGIHLTTKPCSNRENSEYPDQLEVQDDGNVKESKSESLQVEPTEKVVKTSLTDRVSVYIEQNLSFKKLPFYRKDNKYIMSGYRPEFQCVYACFRSMFQLHNETINIWSHLIAAIVFFKLAIWLAFYPTPMFNFWDKFMLVFYCWGVITGMTLSWIFHTVECHSENIRVFFNKLDYLGICLLIASGFIPYIYFAFYCENYFKVIYILGISISSLALSVLIIQNKWENPNLREFRTTLFSFLVVFGLLPYFHYFMVKGFWRISHFSSGGWMVITIILLLSGAIFYTSTFPECWFPGQFDIYFQSHQIMHVLVSLALFVHCIGISDFAQQVKICKSCAVGCNPTSVW